MEHSEYQARLRERKHLRASNQDYERVKTLKIKVYNDKVPRGKNLDTMSAIILDLRRVNRLNYSGIQTFGVLGSFCSRNSDDKLSRGVNL